MARTAKLIKALGVEFRWGNLKCAWVCGAGHHWNSRLEQSGRTGPGTLYGCICPECNGRAVGKFEPKAIKQFF